MVERIIIFGMFLWGFILIDYDIDFWDWWGMVVICIWWW